MSEPGQDSVEALFQRGTEFHGQGAFEAAADLFRRANKLDPRHPEIWGNLGAACMEMGALDQAERAYRKALKLNPDFAIVHNNLGSLYRTRGQLRKAEQSYRRALKILPTFGDAAANLGSVLIVAAKYDEARAWLEGELAEGPHVGLYKGLGLLHEILNEGEKAVDFFNKALGLDPANVEVLNNLGISLQYLGRNDEAKAAYERALSHEPERMEVLQNLGVLMLNQDRYDEAAEAFRQALRIDPNARAVYPYLAIALTFQCSWSELPAITEKIIANTEFELAQGLQVSADPFGMLSLSTTHDLRARVTEAAAERIQDRIRPIARANQFAYAPRGPKLKIGLVSPDFRRHSAAYLFDGICEHYDRERFEFHGYMLSILGHDDMTEFFRDQLDGFRTIRTVPLEDAARQIAADGINVLVDLAGHTQGSWLDLFAMRPAPVQASAIGYGSAIGGNLVDYLISDDAMWPEHDRQYCSESIVYLPYASLPGSPRKRSARTLTRAEAGLPEAGTVFANFNGHYKFDAQAFGAWMHILGALPGSVLWVMEGSKMSRANLTAEAKIRGVAADRLVFARKIPPADHISRLGLADVALDGFNLEGGATTLDALWAGVPVLVARGETFSNRGRSKMLEVLELGELIAGSGDAYQRIAIELGTDAATLTAVKAKLAENVGSTPLFDIHLFTRHFERAC